MAWWRNALAALLLCVAGSVSAQAEWALAAYVGGTHSAETYLAIAQPSRSTQLTFDGVRYSGESFVGPIYYGVRSGYFFPFASFLGVEVEFIHQKIFADTTRQVLVRGTYGGVPISQQMPMKQIVQGFSISHGLNYLLINAVVRHRLGRTAAHPRGRLILVGRIGAGPSIPHPESAIDGVGLQHYEAGAAALHLAGGAEIHLWRGLYALGEYKFTRSRQSVEVVAGTAQTLLRSHHGVFGLAYHF